MLQGGGAVNLVEGNTLLMYSVIPYVRTVGSRRDRMPIMCKEKLHFGKTTFGNGLIAVVDKLKIPLIHNGSLAVYYRG
ncbi:hypothetical protein BUALT_Bualt02G0137900 [Buddleja alternifolia]|uniref:Uncharacterized protein n=1 Tax=Buddleja alternifolia TaxID=168488 RepID=A0AAV6Y254_9LAMI|nr:hypothetical protein BUALT_Bualt02G0137900 [Buddleja alternifolia]